MNVFETGVRWARKQLLDHASEEIAISRGAERWTTRAVVAQTEFDDANGDGRRVNVYLVDFIISAEVGYIPAKGDYIEYRGAVYVVRPRGKEIWRYGDPQQLTVRIHSQLERRKEAAI